MIELVVNFILCLAILALGIWAYTKKRYDVPLYIGIAFGLFAISHLLKLIGLAEGLGAFLIVVRIVAYLLVIYALIRVVVKK